MRKWIAAAGLVIASLAGAQTTPNLGLQLPTYQTPNWGTALNYNFSRIDGYLSGGYTLPAFSANGLTLANITGQLQCLQVNASGVVSGTTLGCGAGFVVRGLWTANTSYHPNDIYTEAGTAYVVLTAYTSGATFGTLDTNNSVIFADSSGLGYTPLNAAGGTMTGTLTANGIVDSALIPSTSAICPNGTGGQFTTSGCTAIALAAGTLNQIQINDGSGVISASAATADAAGNLNAASLGTPDLINVKQYGCKGNGSSDDTACIKSAVTAVNSDTASRVELYFPSGTYEVNPTETGGNALMNFSRGGIIVTGDNASVQIVTSATPYNQLLNVASGSTYYWNYVVSSSSNIIVEKMTFDSNGQTEAVTCTGTYGCFWASGVYISGTPAPNNIKVINNSFLTLGGWPVLAGATNVLIRGNYAEQSKGIVCANGSQNCTISDNISIDSTDAPYAANGGSTTSALVTNFVISNNIAIGNGSNGSGIDVTAAQDGSVSGNYITGSGNWCIQVDKTSGSYTAGAAGTYLPAREVKISDNTCIGNSVYGGWPNGANAEILVGDAYPDNGATPFTAGQTAQNITVSDNHISAFNPAGDDAGVFIGFGAEDIHVNSNDFSGCGSVQFPSTSCTANYYSDVASGTSGISIIGNTHILSANVTGRITTISPGPYLIAENDMLWNAAANSPGSTPIQFGSGVTIGTSAWGAPLNVYGVINTTLKYEVNGSQISSTNLSDGNAVMKYCGTGTFSAGTTSTAATGCSSITSSSHCQVTWTTPPATAVSVGYTPSAGSVVATAGASTSGTVAIACSVN